MSDSMEIEIVKGVEGLALYINQYRVCGPKPWGGGMAIQSWKCTKKDLLTAIEQEREDE